jgi:hypothetical protein
VVAVGDSAEVELIFTSYKGHGGPVAKSATVTCNDNDRGNFQLSLKGKTYESADSLVPLTLSVRAVAWDQETRTKEAKLLVKNVSKDAVKMSLVSQPYGYLKITLPDGDIKPGKEKEIKVKIDSAIKDIEFKKSFTFALNDSAGTRYTIPTVLTKPGVTPPVQSPTENKVVVPDTTKKPIK